jgi:hypothetical protein
MSDPINFTYFSMKPAKQHHKHKYRRDKNSDCFLLFIRVRTEVERGFQEQTMFFRVLILVALLKSSKANEVICKFDTLTFWGYTCGVVNQTVLNDSEIVFNIDEIDHGRSASDVNCVEFADSTIDFVPQGIFTTFPKVDRLIFMENKFKVWKKEYLQNADNLIAFVNADNLIETLDDDSFPHTPNLLVLSLYNNKISEISAGAFRSLQQLSILQLSGNQISSIDENLFRELDSLEMLDLFDNNLSILPSNVFDFNEKLQSLRLDGNKLTVIGPTIFDRDSNLKSLNVTENLILSIDAKVLPENLEVIFVGKWKFLWKFESLKTLSFTDHFTEVSNAPASLKVIRMTTK